MSAVIRVYKARARRNGYRMFISVYILWSMMAQASLYAHKYRLMLEPNVWM